MAITTKDNAKALLGITVTTWDTMITALIPLVEKEYLSIRNKPFDTGVVGEKVGVGDGSTLTFTVTNKPVIYESLTVYLTADDGTLDEVSDTLYTFNYTTGVITFLTAPGAARRVIADYESVNVIYPDGAELTAAQMIGYRLFTSKNIGEKSESLGDYSVTFEKDDMVGGYPRSITGAIERFAKFA